MRFTRRNLIVGLLAGFGLDPSGVLGTLGGRARGAFTRLAQASQETAPASLSEAELADLLAFAEVLVEGRALSPVERGYLSDHILARTTQGAGYYLSLYRASAAALERLAGARFASLDVAQRVGLMTRHRLTSSGINVGELSSPLPEDERALRTRAVPDLIGGYYGSPAGWAVVGYDTFPGKCGDLARYTAPER